MLWIFRSVTWIKVLFRFCCSIQSFEESLNWINMFTVCIFKILYNYVNFVACRLYATCIVLNTYTQQQIETLYFDFCIWTEKRFLLFDEKEDKWNNSIAIFILLYILWNRQISVERSNEKRKIIVSPSFDIKRQKKKNVYFHANFNRILCIFR